MVLSDEEKVRRTFRCDLIKGPFTGIVEAGWLSFTLLVAIRHFHAPEGLKAAYNAAHCVGLLLTPASLYLASRQGWRPHRASAVYVGAGACMLMIISIAPTLMMLSACYFTAALLFPQRAPMDIQIYAQNYAKADRGRLLSTTFILAALFGAAFSYFGGQLLDHNLTWYPWLYIAIGGSALIVAVTYLWMPSEPLARHSSGNPVQNFKLAREDKLFGHLLGAWMLLGMGNLMTLPIRIEYIANEKYGINASNEQVALIVIATPLLFRVLSARFWGQVFDRINLVHTRNLLNTFFLSSILIYFLTDNLWVMTAGSVLFGMALGGGNILWSLWVTKIAPAEQVPAYQSVHSAMTGVRGIIAPFLGYAILSISDPQTVSWVGSGFLICAMILFWRVRKDPRLN